MRTEQLEKEKNSAKGGEILLLGCRERVVVRKGVVRALWRCKGMTSSPKSAVVHSTPGTCSKETEDAEVGITRDDRRNQAGRHTNVAMLYSLDSYSLASLLSLPVTRSKSYRATGATPLCSRQNP